MGVGGRGEEGEGGGGSGQSVAREGVLTFLLALSRAKGVEGGRGDR
jgi:hypothetical protein